MQCKNLCPRYAMGKSGYCNLCLRYFKENNKLKRYGYIKFTDQCSRPENGCWNWSGVLTSNGYGLYQTKMGRVELAHRTSYEHYVGPILFPQLDHLCINRRCVNPSHLEPVTASENQIRIGQPARV